MPLLKWLDVRPATQLGAALAERFASGKALAPEIAEQLWLQAQSEARALRLNFYQRARLAASLEKRLIEKGVEPVLADEITVQLVMRITARQAGTSPRHQSAGRAPRPADTRRLEALVTQAGKCLVERQPETAQLLLQGVLQRSPHHAMAHNLLAVAHLQRGRYNDAQTHLLAAISARPDLSEAHCNLGFLKHTQGLFKEAATHFRRALELAPKNRDARVNLGHALVQTGSLTAARQCFETALQTGPPHARALFGLGCVARLEGNFDRAGNLFERALKADPNMPAALAAMAGLRRMTADDGQWLARAEALLAGDLPPMEAADLRFAIGKFLDDTGRYDEAFENFRLANTLLKASAADYEPKVYTRFVNEAIRTYTRNSIAAASANACTSDKPIFVVGMMRSGTSLAEQILASHPKIVGAGELGFWQETVLRLAQDLQNGPPGADVAARIAESYLAELATHGAGAAHVVDKAPVNANHLGLIHSVFPRARIIYMRRNPIDTCLSCYFSPLSPTFTYTMDLEDLAHHMREHQRLYAHWRSVLPADAILEVPYESLVEAPESWTRKMLAFVGVEWDERCLAYYNTERPVVTASYWQVRQKPYRDALQRWRHYDQYIGPLEQLA